MLNLILNSQKNNPKYWFINQFYFLFEERIFYLYIIYLLKDKALYIIHNMKSIIVEDQTIIDFFKKNKDIDIVAFNHIIIDYFQKISTEQNETANDVISNQVLPALQDFRNYLYKIAPSNEKIYYILQQIFPNDEIVACSEETSASNFIVNRTQHDEGSILFVNKDYSHSVPTDEIELFEKNVKEQKSHGIFISHSSNITYKEPFQVDVIDGLIHVYIQNVQYNMEKINIAVNIINVLSKELNNEIATINITNDNLRDLLEMFNEFNEQKRSLIEDIKSSNKLLLNQINNMQLNSVKKLLSKYINLQNDA